MNLSRADFEQRYAENNLRIALIGMSNIGKSYTAMRLSTHLNFDLVEVDKIIWEKLGQDSMADFAAWQGQPYSEGYTEREAKSIALETDATASALTRDVGNAILDTTGSVIYTAEDVQNKLSRDWYIVHISASEAAVERLKIQYFEQPKPLIWHGHFNQCESETNTESILRCYPDLLASRAKDYAALADATIRSDVILDHTLSIKDIFEHLKPAI